MIRQERKAAPEVQALLDQGKTTIGTRQYDAAAAYYDQALVKARELNDPYGEMEALRGKGIVFMRIGQAQKAFELYNQFLALAHFLGDKQREAKALALMGAAYGDLQQTSKALELLAQALALYHALGATLDEANVLYVMGQNNRNKGNLQKAIELYQQALALYQTVGNKQGVAQTQRELGDAFTLLGEPTKGLELSQQSLTLFRSIGDKAAEAIALNRIGLAYMRLSEQRKALDFLNQALALFQAMGDKRGEAGALGNIAVVYSNLGQNEKALEFFTRLLPLLQAVGDKRSEAELLHNIGGLYTEKGQPQNGLEFLTKAGDLYHQLEDKAGEAANLVYMGNAYYGLKEMQKAVAFFNQALSLFRTVGDKVRVAATLAQISVVYGNLGQLEKAVESDIQSRDVFRALGNKSAEASTLSNLAAAYERLHRPAEAEQCYQDALAIYEALRNDLASLTEAKVSYLQTVLPVYYGYLSFLLDQGKPTDAFEVAQKTKGRSLIELIRAGRVNLDSKLTPQERQQQQVLRQRADLLNTQMVKEGVQNELGAKKRFAALKAELQQTESQLQTLTDALTVRHLKLPQVDSTSGSPSAPLLLPADTALLEYVLLSPTELALFIVTRQGVKARRIKCPQLAAQTTQLRDCCADPRKDYRPLARAIYTLLVAPAIGLLKGIKRLVICPDGALWDVPFQALLSGGQFLAQRYELAYAYSATSAQAALTVKAGRKKPTQTLLALANPDFGSAQRFGDLDDLPGQRPIKAPDRPIKAPDRPIKAPDRPIKAPDRNLGSPMSDTYARGKAIAALPGTQREVEALKKLFPSATLMTGKNAQESLAKAEVGKYRYLHFATHGFFNDASPLLSSLVLAVPTPSSLKEDGFLTAREIFDLDLSAELVVLSACNTARGVQRTGDGIIGLTWALFVAGCPTQVVSQWSVDDASTVTLMARFYRNLATKKLGKGAALRQASLALLDDSKYAHPYYWAPFVLMGDWR